MQAEIEKFLAAKAFAVAGASRDQSKYGNKVLRCYLQHHKKVVPIHPRETMLEGVSCLSTLADLSDDVTSLSIITPPAVTAQLVDQAITKGSITSLWMQPGAESPQAIAKAKAHGIQVIAGGPCLLVVLGFSESL